MSIKARIHAVVSASICLGYGQRVKLVKGECTDLVFESEIYLAGALRTGFISKEEVIVEPKTIKNKPMVTILPTNEIAILDILGEPISKGSEDVRRVLMDSYGLSVSVADEMVKNAERTVAMAKALAPVAEDKEEAKGVPVKGFSSVQEELGSLPVEVTEDKIVIAAPLGGETIEPSTLKAEEVEMVKLDGEEMKMNTWKLLIAKTGEFVQSFATKKEADAAKAEIEASEKVEMEVTKRNIKI